jgi:adenosylcobinamide-GDP ribazoletransferase
MSVPLPDLTPWWQREARLLAVALQFLTRLPTPRLANWQAQWLTDCVRYFPLVGALVGMLGAAVLWLGAQLWPAYLAALLAMAATACITGAFHEDGLADTFDALGGSVPRERALAIMKDSRIGSYGALALVLVTLLRVAALGTLAQHSLPYACAALVLTHALARAAPVWVMARLPYAGDEAHAKAKPLARGVGTPLLLVAFAWAATIAALLLLWLPWPHVLLAIAAAGVVALFMQRWLRKRLGGYTGDTLGATEQLAEAALLLCLSATIH